jgi:phosphatidylserine decarboxylase
MSASDASVGDRAFAALQYLLPEHLMSRTIYGLTRSRNIWLRNRFINHFLRAYPIDMTEAAESNPYAYPTFNEFFTRALKPGVRPIAAEPDAFVSPVDGFISQCGTIDDDTILQAKGQRYSLTSLLGGDAGRARTYLGGSFACIYLAPFNYHRIHMPYAGAVTRTLYVPGELFSVNGATARTVPNLFARNERVVCEFASERGQFAMAYIGALHVGSMATTWGGEVNPPPQRKKQTIAIDRGLGTTLAKGAEAGRFNMGSTVVIVTPPGFLEWSEHLKPNATVRMGEKIGTVL